MRRSISMAIIVLVGLAMALLVRFRLGLPVGLGLAAVGLGALLFIAPGFLLSSLICPRTTPSSVRLLAGLVVGPSLAATLYFLAATGGSTVSGFVPPVLLLMGLGGIWLTWTTRSREDLPPSTIAAAAASLAAWAVVCASFGWASSRDGWIRPDGGMWIGYLDTAFHWSLADFCRWAVPPATPSFPAMPASYHFYPHLLAARLADLTGLDVSDALNRVVRVYFQSTTALGAAVFGWRARPGDRLAPLLTVALVFLAGSPLAAPILAGNMVTTIRGGHSFANVQALTSIDQIHLIVGSAGSAAYCALPAILTLLLECSARSGIERLRLAMMAGVILALFPGMSGMFSVTTALALTGALVFVAARDRDWKLAIAAVVPLVVTLLLYRALFRASVPLETTLHDPAALFGRVKKLLVLAGVAMLPRLLALGIIPLRPRALLTASPLVLFTVAGLFGWVAGFLVLSIWGGNEWHFLTYLGMLFAFLAGPAWSDAIGSGRSESAGDVTENPLPISLRAGAIAALVCAALAIPLLVDNRRIQLLAGGAWLGCAAVAAFLWWRRTRPAPRLRAIACGLLLLPCCTAGIDVASWYGWHTGYVVPAELVAASRWIGDHSQDGRPFISTVRTVPGRTADWERLFAPQAIAGVPSIGDAAGYMALQENADFLATREVLDAWLAGRRVAPNRHLDSARFLLCEKAQARALARAIPGLRLALQTDNYLVWEMPAVTK